VPIYGKYKHTTAIIFHDLNECKSKLDRPEVGAVQKGQKLGMPLLSSYH